MERYTQVVFLPLTIVVDVLRLLLGVVGWNTLDLHSHQRVNDGFLLVLVEFRQLLSCDHLLKHKMNTPSHATMWIQKTIKSSVALSTTGFCVSHFNVP